MQKQFFLLAILWLAATACRVDSSQYEAVAEPVTVRMQADADLSTDFFAQPFPLETRRNGGHYDLSGFPNPGRSELISVLAEVIEPELQGYGTNAAVYFSFSGPLTFEAAVTDPATAMHGAAAALILNVDPDSPEYLEFSPVLSTFYRGESRFVPPNTLAVLPAPGFPLREDTLYAALVLHDHGLAGQDGPLVQAGALRRALDGTGPWGETFLPLVEALPLVDLEPSSVAAATVFRTMDITGPVFKARDWLYAEGPTAAVTFENEHVSLPGFPSIRGTFDAVRFQHGAAPFTERGQGAFQLNDSGVPMAAGIDRLRLRVFLPDGEPPADGWPVVIYAHGTGGSYDSGVYPEGYRLAEQGIALVSYDQPWHGTRHPDHADGESFCTNNCPMLYTFNLMNPVAARDGFRQSALDAVQLRMALRTLRFRFQGAGPEHHFDASRTYYMGHSQGSTSGPIFVAAEDDGIRAAVFSGPAAGLGLAMLYKTEPIDIPGLFGLVLGDHEGFDAFHPVLSLFQSFVKPADPMNYAVYLAHEPREGATRDLLITEGMLDEFTPPIQAEAFAVAARVQPVSPVYSEIPGMLWRGLAAVEAPFRGNLLNADGASWTGALLQFPDDGHFAIYGNPTAERAYVEFLADKVHALDTPALLDDYGER